MQFPNIRAVAHELRHRVDRAVRAFNNPFIPELSSGQLRALQFRALGAPGVGSPPTKEIQDLPVNTIPAWNLAAIQGVINSQSNGNFGQSSLLVESMLTDDAIQAATNGRIKGVTKSNVTMAPSLIGGKRRHSVAKELEALWPELFPQALLEQILTWMIFEGFALVEMIWFARDDRWVPRFKVWHPLYIWYDISKRQYVANTAAGPLYIDPNDPKWFLFVPFGQYRGWLRGAVRSCAIPWIIRQFALRDWARYSEVHGLPQKKVKYPAQAPADAKASFFATIKRLGAETAFALPQQAGQDASAWDVELLEAKDGSWKGFDGLIERCTRSITLNIRGTDLNQQGSFAKATALRDEDSDYAEADIHKFGSSVKEQVLTWYCLYNYGTADLAPTPQFKGSASFELSVDATANIVTVNEGRSAKGLGPLMDNEGEERPDGQMTISEFAAANANPQKEAALTEPDTLDTPTPDDTEEPDNATGAPAPERDSEEDLNDGSENA